MADVDEVELTVVTGAAKAPEPFSKKPVDAQIDVAQLTQTVTKVVQRHVIACGEMFEVLELRKLPVEKPPVIVEGMDVVLHRFPESAIGCTVEISDAQRFTLQVLIVCCLIFGLAFAGRPTFRISLSRSTFVACRRLPRGSLFGICRAGCPDSVGLVGQPLQCVGADAAHHLSGPHLETRVHGKVGSLDLACQLDAHEEARAE